MAVTHVPASTAVPEPGALLRTALAQIRRGSTLPVAFGGIASRGGRGVRLTEFTGLRTDALRGLVIPPAPVSAGGYC